MRILKALALASVLHTASAQGSNDGTNANGTVNSTSPQVELPVVDLGYVLQQATSYNESGDFYEFKNIRYAAPPLGNLRFRRPQRPATNRTVENGSDDRRCPQAFPSWVLGGQSFAYQYRPGGTYNASEFDTSDFQPGPASGAETEDCLFLDLAVPKKIFDRRDEGEGEPVMVWIHGGGYTLGSKAAFGSPSGLIARSQKDGDLGIVYVTINYRLGAFGWLAGPSVQADGTANAGLWDQRFALQWVQRHISKFGGCNSKVTAIGESAGGGSIMHQITAFGGERGPAPFQQAILQSPAFRPVSGNNAKENIYVDFLKLLNVTSLAAARNLSTLTLQTANIKQVSTSIYGRFTYGPVVDGDFAPDLPGALLQRGQFDDSVKIMMGHNANEGILFTSPANQNNSQFDATIERLYPFTRLYPELKTYITETLYPPVFDGTYGYLENIGRAALVVSESVFTCNTFYLSKAFNNKTYSYEFAVPPGIHGQDVAYTFYNGAIEADNPTAFTMQQWITSFAIHSTPNYGGNVFFPRYGNNATINILNTTGVRTARDDNASQRCNWWQKALYA